MKTPLIQRLVLVICITSGIQLCGLLALLFLNFRRSPDSSSAIIAVLLLAALCCSVTMVIAICLFARRNLRAHRILQENAVRLANEGPLRHTDDLDDPGLAQIDQLLKDMAKSLEHARRKERALLDNSNEVICSVSERLSFLAISKSSNSVWQRDSFLLADRSIMELIGDTDQQQILADAFHTASSKNGSAQADIRIKLGDGASRWNRWTVTWSNVERMYFCTVADTTQQKELELRKQEFIAMVSHDLKTPLTVMTNFINTLGDGKYATLTDRGNERCLLVKRTLDTLVKMVNDVLNMERLESGELKLQRADVPARQLGERTLEQVQGYAESRQVKLNFKLPDDFLICCDGDRIVQVLTNILGNAIKFSPEHETVMLRITKSENGAVFEVTDRGPGIPQSRHEMIFERFKQSDNTESREGTGLGLAIAKSLVVLHGGKIGVTSKPGEGSVFWFSIPALNG